MIRGYFESDAAGPLAALVTAYLWVPALGAEPDNVTQVEFLLDTGSMLKVLMP